MRSVHAARFEVGKRSRMRRRSMRHDPGRSPRCQGACRWRPVATGHKTDLSVAPVTDAEEHKASLVCNCPAFSTSPSPTPVARCGHGRRWMKALLLGGAARLIRAQRAGWAVATGIDLGCDDQRHQQSNHSYHRSVAPCLREMCSDQEKAFRQPPRRTFRVVGQWIVRSWRAKASSVRHRPWSSRQMTHGSTIR
jgi:hypothetical protein